MKSLLLLCTLLSASTNAFVSLSRAPRWLLPVTTDQREIVGLSSAAESNGDNSEEDHLPYQHTLAILAMPATSVDRIVNENILNTAVASSHKLSVVLRCQGREAPTVAALRRYVGEIYSQLWDCVMEESEELMDLDVVVYPQNLPNAAPESWLDIQPDLDCVCSHDALTGWVSEAATGRGTRFQNSQGVGGLEAHVQALNRERSSRGLSVVEALPVPLGDALIPGSSVEKSPLVVFLEDDQGAQSNLAFQMNRNMNDSREDRDDSSSNGAGLLGGAVRASSEPLYDSVAVGGTFDGLHFGHRKLLTLAVSSVTPVTGRLLVGVTMDAMLTRKAYADYLPDLEERMAGVRQFLQRLAPGIMKYVRQ
jgi:cytidyltransferase-like protein